MKRRDLFRYFEDVEETSEKEVGDDLDEVVVNDTRPTNDTSNYDPFEHLTKEEVLEHYGIKENPPQQNFQMDTSQDIPEEIPQGQDRDIEPMKSEPSKSEPPRSEPPKSEPPKDRRQDNRGKGQDWKKEDGQKRKSTTKPSHKSSWKSTRPTRKVITRMFSLNGCQLLLPLKNLDVGGLLDVYGDDFYIVSLYNPKRTQGFNMVRTLQFLKYLRTMDYGYFPIYTFDKNTKTVQNIFLMVFNYTMTPSYRTSVQGRRTSPSFFKDVRYNIRQFGLQTYIYNVGDNLFIKDNGELFSVEEEMDLETLINYYSKRLGSYSRTSSLYFNNLPTPLERDDRTLKGEICVDESMLTYLN